MYVGCETQYVMWSQKQKSIVPSQKHLQPFDSRSYSLRWVNERSDVNKRWVLKEGHLKRRP